MNIFVNYMFLHVDLVFLNIGRQELTYKGHIVISESGIGSGPLAEGQVVPEQSALQNSRWRSSQLFKMLVMLLLHFHEPCWTPQQDSAPALHLDSSHGLFSFL